MDDYALPSPLSPDEIVTRALQRQEETGRWHVSVPIQDAPFLRAFGVDLSMSPDQGVKIKTPLFERAKDLEEALPLSVERVVFQDVFRAIDRLCADRVPIVYKMPSPMNVLEGILPFDQSIRLSRRDPALFQAINDQIISFMHEVIRILDRKGVAVVYFFDSFGSLELLGPAFYQRVYADLFRQLFEIQVDLEQSSLAMARTISLPLEETVGLKKDEQSRLYIAGQNRHGQVSLLVPVTIRQG